MSGSFIPTEIETEPDSPLEPEVVVISSSPELEPSGAPNVVNLLATKSMVALVAAAGPASSGVFGAGTTTIAQTGITSADGKGSKTAARSAEVSSDVQRPSIGPRRVWPYPLLDKGFGKGKAKGNKDDGKGNGDGVGSAAWLMKLRIARQAGPVASQAGAPSPGSTDIFPTRDAAIV
jgi:hypothetical protein